MFFNRRLLLCLWRNMPHFGGFLRHKRHILLRPQFCRPCRNCAESSQILPAKVIFSSVTLVLIAPLLLHGSSWTLQDVLKTRQHGTSSTPSEPFPRLDRAYSAILTLRSTPVPSTFPQQAGWEQSVEISAPSITQGVNGT